MAPGKKASRRTAARRSSGSAAPKPASSARGASKGRSPSRTAAARALLMVDAKQMRRLETNANELGVSNAMMMARAGQAVAEFVLARPDAGAILFCGKGNNGGDGLAAASLLLQAKRKVHVILVEGRVDTPLAKELLSGLPKKAVTHWEGRVRDGWQENDHVLVDAMLGVGFHGKMSGAYAEAARFLSTRARAGQVVLSVDVPSGLGAPGAVQPTHTLALHAMKAGMTKKNSGTILAADIGVPAKAEECGLGDLDAAYPRPKWESRKGDNGRVLIIGGSIPYVGAVHYAAMAAFRSGADLVHVVAPSECASALRAMGPHTIVHDAPGDRHLTPDALAVIKPLLARCGAVVLGCGLGPHPESRRLAGLVMDEAARKRLPMLIDAEALDAVTPALLRRHGGRIVLTPHGGEFQRIAHKAASAAHVVAFAKANKTTVLRKAATDVISNGADTRLSSRGHPGLTVGGIGDVHAGSIGALLAKGTPPFEAACAGAYLVGAAGEIAASLRSYGLVATDVIEALPAVLMRLP